MTVILTEIGVRYVKRINLTILSEIISTIGIVSSAQTAARTIEVRKMARYIDADALTELYDMGEEMEDYAAVLSVPIPIIRQNIADMPTIDAVEVVHGRWVDLGRNYYTVVSQCSECGAKYDFRSPYCPNCGAEMRTKEEE